jgi:hypothetical protein
MEKETNVRSSRSRDQALRALACKQDLMIEHVILAVSTSPTLGTYNRLLREVPKEEVLKARSVSDQLVPTTLSSRSSSTDVGHKAL